MYGYNIAAKYIFSSYLLPYISVLTCKWFCHKICCGCFIFCHQFACIGHFNFCFICCCFYLFSFSFCRMYSVCQKGQHVNLKKNSDYGDQQTDYSVSKCGDSLTEDKLFDGNIPGPQTLAQREMVKNMIYSNCRSSSVSGKQFQL